MTDGDSRCQSDSRSARSQQSGASVNKELPETNSLPAESVTATKEEICEFLSKNPTICFKSQQIDDPDLSSHEKLSIALDIYNENQQKFLLRFGKYLRREHLQHFRLNSGLNDGETLILIRELLLSLETHDRSVKNRRYAALQAMIRADNYFSEREIMKREPHLYEQMVGQYLTDAEKRARDRIGGEDCEAFSGVLLDNYDKDEMEKLRKQQAREDISDEDTNMSESSQGATTASQLSENENLFPKIPLSQRKQWGNFEDDDGVDNIPGTGPLKSRKREDRFITAGEREMLRQEFMDIMYEKFLEGKDEDFDYTAVDNNADLDDLKQIDQDSEDKYFDGDDDDDDTDGKIIQSIEADSEDELDIYMKHLSKHSAVVKQVDS